MRGKAVYNLWNQTAFFETRDFIPNPYTDRTAFARVVTPGANAGLDSSFPGSPVPFGVSY
jgi:hypothetical protein